MRRIPERLMIVSLERELQPRVDAALGGPIAAVGCAATEGDVLELPRDLHEAVQVPVDADDGIPGLAGRRGRIGKVRYGVVVDLQLAVARGQFEAAPGALRSVERLPGHD